MSIQSISAYDGAIVVMISDTASLFNGCNFRQTGVDCYCLRWSCFCFRRRNFTDYSANISFDIRDTADAIAAEVVGTGNANELDDANSVFVSGGDVTVDEASAIQAISGYSSVPQITILLMMLKTLKASSSIPRYLVM